MIIKLVKKTLRGLFSTINFLFLFELFLVGCVLIIIGFLWFAPMLVLEKILTWINIDEEEKD